MIQKLFILFIIAVNRTCNQTLNGRYGIITTPNYPNAYPNGVSCIWKIKAPRGYYIELSFHDFDIEPYDDCKSDVLEIKDGSSRRCPLLGMLFIFVFFFSLCCFLSVAIYTLNNLNVV